MPDYKYNARNQQGELVAGTIDAPNEAIVMEIMRERNLILLEVKLVKHRTQSLRDLEILGTGIKNKDVVIFARQLAVLISATVPIVRALRILTKQSESKALQTVIQDVADQVDGGARLSAALHKHKRVFDDFFVYMIRAGETTGRLDEVLVYLADQKEKDFQLRSKILSAMIYPSFIVVVLIAIFIFMMIFVIPKLLGVVSESGAELPWVTKILLSVSSFFTGYWWLLLFLLFIAVAGYIVMRGKPKGQELIDAAKLRFPIIGGIFHKIYLARICRSLSNLLASGVPVNRSITIVGDVVGNNVFKIIMAKAVEDIEGGRSISQSFAQHSQIPPMMAQMVNVGEETGRLDLILGKLAEFYNNEVDALTSALVSLVEPIIIILLGVGALILVSGVLLPIYQITAQF